MVHLVNYRADGPVERIAVRLEVPQRRRVQSVLLAGPERSEDQQLPFEQQSRAVVFTVPQVRTYEIAVVTLQ